MSSIETAKVGDLIKRKDTPFIFQIVSENKEWRGMWNIKRITHPDIPRRCLKYESMVSKDDDRWIIVKGG